MRARRHSIPVRLGNVIVGGGAPVSVQSMTKTDTRDIGATINQLRCLADAGCNIVRLAVPDLEAASALSTIRRQAAIPLVADIHFDYRLAIAAIEAGIDGLRLNPGNISQPDHLRTIVRHASERSIPIRIGVNAGSLPHDYQPGTSLPQRMVSLALEQVQMLEALDFQHIKISLKASDVPTTIDAYRLIADQTAYPLHVGVTEAGPPICGAIRNTLGIGVLLYMGIGDTIRVSLSGDPLMEVDTGKEILRSLGLMSAGASVISCPSCGRTTLDVSTIATQVMERLRSVTEPFRVAVMGCVVNGPGECEHADVGIAGGEDKVLVYRSGTFKRSVPIDQASDALLQEIDSALSVRPAETSEEMRKNV